MADITVTSRAEAVSRLIRGVTHSTVSHALLYAGGLQVVEAGGILFHHGGTRRRSLELALHEAGEALVFRRRRITGDRPGRFAAMP